MNNRGYRLYRRYFFLSLISLCSLFAGCARQSLNLETQVADSIVTTIQERADSYSEWDAQLRLALRHNKLSWRGIMQWVQREDSFNMAFSDLLGRRLLLIEGRQNGSVSMTDSKGYRKQASDPETLIKSVLGTEVPFDNLYYWLLGAPSPDMAYSNVEFDAQGRLQSYEQNGWVVNYTTYRQDDCLDSLPSHLNLSQTDTQLWLNVRSWRILSDTIKTSAC